jgi:Flp pilus assembly protein TadD
MFPSKEDRLRAFRGVVLLLVLGAAAGSLFAQQSPLPLPAPTGAQDYTESPVKPEISGYVRFPQGVKGESVLVRLETNSGTTLKQVWTNNLGFFTFPEIACGYYMVATDVAGYRPVRIPIEHSFIPLGAIFLKLEPADNQGTTEEAAGTTKIPEKARTEYSKGLEALSKRRPGDSISHFRKAIQLAPDFSDAYFQLGWAYYQDRAYGDAQPVLQKAIQLNQKNAQAYALLGAVYKQESRYTDAVQALQQSLGLEENSCRAHLEMGESLLKLGKVNDAYTHLMRAHALNPGIAQTHVALYNTLILRSDYQAAVTELEEFLRLFPDSPLAPKVRAQREALTKVLAAKH